MAAHLATFSRKIWKTRKLLVLLMCILLVAAYYFGRNSSHDFLYHHSLKNGSVESYKSTSTNTRPPAKTYKLKLLSVPSAYVKIYSAYLNDRPHFQQPSIEVFGAAPTKVLSKKMKLYGLIKFSDTSLKCLQLSRIIKLCNNNKYVHYTKYEFIKVSFKLNEDEMKKFPLSISLSSHKTCSQSSGPIHLHHIIDKPKTIGLCLQTPLYGTIKTLSLIQSIEMHKLLGVEHFTIYTLVPTSKVYQILKSYIVDGILDLVEWPREFKKKGLYHYHGQILSMNDCFYRNIHRVKYLTFVDLDEIIIPRSPQSSLMQMIRSFHTPTDMYLFSNVYYVQQHKTASSSNTVDYLTHLHRVACNYKPYRRSKYIIRLSAINDVCIHGASSHNVTIVPAKVGSLHHYRSKVTKDCTHRTLIYDPIMLTYEQPLINAVNKRLKLL